MPIKALGANWKGHRVGLGLFSSSVAQSFPSVEATKAFFRLLSGYAINNDLYVCSESMP